MQEEVENRTVTLVVSATRMTGRVLKAAISKYLAYRKSQKAARAAGSVIPRGKQSVKELVGQNQGVSSIEINDKNIRDFDRVARKYGVDYAVKKDRSGDVPRYLVFFKARDGDVLNAAFREYTAAVTGNLQKPSLIQKLRAINPLQKERPKAWARDKEKELEL